MTSDGQIRTIPLAVWRDAKIDGDRLRRARKAAGLNQIELAEAVGVHRVTPSAWERDVSVPGPEARARLVELLDLDLKPDDE